MTTSSKCIEAAAVFETDTSEEDEPMLLKSTIGRLSVACGAAALALGAALPVAATTRRGPDTASPYRVHVLIAGSALRHTFIPVGSRKPMSEALSQPDDIAWLDGDLFVIFQNAVGPQGTPSAIGNLDSTIVEISPSGREVAQWDVRGHADGLTADPSIGSVIATVNEDANSSIFTIEPTARDGHAVEQYFYNLSPLPHFGGTDAVSIDNGEILISASAPGTVTGSSPAPNASYPAVYAVTLDAHDHVAVVRSVFRDEAAATVANTGGSQEGQQLRLALTDPDSNEIVPSTSPRFAGSFMLDSQGDKEQIYVPNPASGHPDLWVLSLTQSIDDTAWATDADGTLYATDAAGDTVDAVRGAFPLGNAFVAVTPCDANSAPPSCGASPPSPPNYLGQLDMWTGRIARVSLRGANLQPKGMIFVADQG
jgi:hypothetical protein